MRARLLAFILMLATGLSCVSARAGDGVTAEEARSKFDAAVALYREEGPKAYDKFWDKRGPFRDRDFYIFIIARGGECLFHGTDKSLIGQNLWQLVDPDGVQFIQELWQTADRNPEGGTVRYKFVNPINKTIQRKVVYVRKVGDAMIAGGYYVDK